MKKYFEARHKNPGFSLLEIMIGVAIVAVLSVVAIPSFQKYLYESRRAEAVTMLNNVWKAERNFYEEHGVYRPSYSGPNPEHGNITQPLMFSPPHSRLRYNIIVGNQGAAEGNIYDLTGFRGAGYSMAGSSRGPINKYGFPLLLEDGSYNPKSIYIGAEGNIGASTTKIDAMIMKDGNLFLLCDSTKGDPSPEPVIDFATNFGEAECEIPSDEVETCSSDPSGEGCASPMDE